MEDPPRPVKVHKLTVMIVDHDRLGANGVIQELENARFPNDCLHPDVMAIETREVHWTDDHPLNYFNKQEAAFAALFAKD